MIYYRKAGMQDSQNLLALSIQLGYRNQETDKSNIRQRLTNILNNPEHCIIVATLNKTNESEKVVGWIHAFISYRVESSPFIEIGGLIVDETYRKQGVGKVLVQHIEDWTRELNLQKVRVRCNATRQNSHIFYKKIDFKLIKSQMIFDKKL